MKGIVHYINQQRGIVAVITEQGYSIFEIISGDNVEVGDSVSWRDDTALGGEILTNHTQGDRYEVYFQNHHVHQSQLGQQLLIR